MKTNISQKIQMKPLLDLLRAMAVLLPPIVVTAVLATARLMLTGRDTAPAWDVGCLLLTALVWGAAVFFARSGKLVGGSMPKTGLILSGMLVLSVLFFVLAFAMEQEVIGYRGALWAMGHLFGGPADVSVSGMQVLMGGAPIGSTAMLTCGLYLILGFLAAVPLPKGKRK